MASFFRKLLLKIFLPLSEFLNKKVERENEKFNSKVQTIKEKLGTENKENIEQAEENLTQQFDDEKGRKGRQPKK